MELTIRRASGAHPGGVGVLAVEVLGLVPLDIVEPIDDPAPDLEVGDALPDPAPTLKGPGRDVPTVGQLDLIEVTGRHCWLLLSLR